MNRSPSIWGGKKRRQRMQMLEETQTQMQAPKEEGRNQLGQRSPTFGVLETGSVERGFSTDWRLHGFACCLHLRRNKKPRYQI